MFKHSPLPSLLLVDDQGRVTDPRNFALVGVPPKDLMEEVALAWRQAGLDPVECLRKCTMVTTEFVYDEQEPSFQRRLKPKESKSKALPVRHRSLPEVLDPQVDVFLLFRRGRRPWEGCVGLGGLPVPT